MHFASPVGRLEIRGGTEAVHALAWRSDEAAPFAPLFGAVPSPLWGRGVEAWLADYFGGRFRAPDFPLDPGGTPFQVRVWRALLALPAGSVQTYGELARGLGYAGGSGARAVGGAMRANSLPLILPCHRVVGARGALGGYSGVGGIETKRRLLAWERGEEGLGP
ncbi:MAG: methylated-DNA--[protein]-cysteine S-methyltransferase [Magnetococcales bacterium]|nr:methylated-DNA--[protein]-cysteine S-methyltransferase [Magnetococcales bacterium]